MAIKVYYANFQTIDNLAFSQEHKNISHIVQFIHFSYSAYFFIQFSTFQNIFQLIFLKMLSSVKSCLNETLVASPAGAQ